MRNKKKGLAIAILDHAKKHPDGYPEAPESSSEASSDTEMAAEEILESIKAKDAQRLAVSLKAFIFSCGDYED